MFVTFLIVFFNFSQPFLLRKSGSMALLGISVGLVLGSSEITFELNLQILLRQVSHHKSVFHNEIQELFIT